MNATTYQIVTELRLATGRISDSFIQPAGFLYFQHIPTSHHKNLWTEVPFFWSCSSNPISQGNKKERKYIMWLAMRLICVTTIWKQPKLKKFKKEREIRTLIRHHHANELAQISLLSHCMCLMYVCFSTYLADWTVEKSEKRTVENKQAGTV